MPEYFRRAFDFLKERVGEENIISAVVHMDEKTPPHAPLLCPADQGQAAVRKGDPRQQEKHDPLAG